MASKRVVHLWSRSVQENVEDNGSVGPEFRLPVGEYEIGSDIGFQLELLYKNGGSMGMVELKDGRFFSVTEAAKSRFKVSFGPGRGHSWLLQLNAPDGDILSEYTATELCARQTFTVLLETGVYNLQCQTGEGPNKLAVVVVDTNGRKVAPTSEYTASGALIVPCKPYGKVNVLCEEGYFETLTLTQERN